MNTTEIHRADKFIDVTQLLYFRCSSISILTKSGLFSLFEIFSWFIGRYRSFSHSWFLPFSFCKSRYVCACVCVFVCCLPTTSETHTKTVQSRLLVSVWCFLKNWWGFVFLVFYYYFLWTTDDQYWLGSVKTVWTVLSLHWNGLVEFVRRGTNHPTQITKFEFWRLFEKPQDGVKYTNISLSFPSISPPSLLYLFSNHFFFEISISKNIFVWQQTIECCYWKKVHKK